MTFTAKDPDYAAKVREIFAAQGFMALIGAEIVHLAPGECAIRVPWRQDLTQQHGFFHAGVLGTIADNAAGIASFSLMPPGSGVLTVEYKLNLMAPGQGEAAIARAVVERAGRTITVAVADVFALQDGAEKKIAKATATVMCLQPKG